MENRTCCFIGHRKIPVTAELKNKLYEVIEDLILKKNIDTFLFGSKSEFDSLCLAAVTRAKKKYPRIKRIYVRAEYPYISDDYKNYLLKDYDDTYYPTKIICSGRAVYIRRNRDMIDKSCICVVYCDPDYTSSARKIPDKGSGPARQAGSGTKTACFYAERKGKTVINLAGR